MNTQNFSNLGVVLDEIPEEIFACLKNECKRIQQDWSAEPAGHTLAGSIKREYFLSDSVIREIEPYLIWLLEEYDKEYRYTPHTDSIKTEGRQWQWEVDTVWANFQQKHEFNPIHNHYGAMSFVIWVQIPYSLEQEQLASPEPDHYPKTVSCFQFVICNTLGEVMPLTIPVDREFEGKIMMFPAKMMHTVYPFYTSDDYRISISGNLKKTFR